MANHYAYYNQSHISNNKIKKVYINPNFNRSDHFPTSSSNMYLNPNFSQNASMYHHTMPELKEQISKARIHVNPNFIRNANVNPQVFTDSLKEPVSISTSLMNNSLCKEHKQEAKIQFQPHVTKSRYCLVRQKENTTTKTSISKPVTTTVRVNKYKSVSLNVVKNNLATANSSVDSFSINEKYPTPLKTKISPTSTRFKFVKPSGLNQSQTKPVRRHSILNKSILKTASRKTVNKFVLKVNNIPCPLFKKYGKCLRKIQGNCEYLHDKKHVSICRKFLKGICHDEDCLLSHDLTDKKMPTCYFYLQGACTKESCPYLHVKLNEKTKICQDFLKGYCEKGEKCLFRHINVCKDTALKQVMLKEQLTYSSSSKTSSVVKVKNKRKSLVMLTQQDMKARRKGLGPHAEEPRYFKESVEDKSSSVKCNDIIKPSRIKLGTLPSFIGI